MFNLENLYNPKCIIASSKNKHCYVRIKPSTNLSRFIYCYWASPGDLYDNHMSLPHPKDESIVPDGCLDIVFYINRKTGTCKSAIYGTLDKPFSGNLAYDKIQTFGITFYPGGFYPFLRIPLIELKNKVYSLDDAMNGTWEKLCLGISNANTINEMIIVSNKYLSSLLDGKTISCSLLNMLYTIYKSKGTLPVNELAQSEVLSERQIARIFNNWVGISPKTFSKIVRFQNVINSTIRSTTFNWISIALDNGYYDESHLFNDFKELYGAAPGEYLKNI